MRYGLALFCLVLAMIHLPVSRTETVEVGQSRTRVRFDFADGAFSATQEKLVLRPRHVGARALKTIPRGDGWAIQFPPVCRDTPKSCPRAILEADPAPWLNPKAKAIKWGASVLIEPGMTTDGENVMQK